MSNVLFMTLMRKWFYEILEGRKKIEYRLVKPYWTKRIVGREYDKILFKNGYGSKAPMMLVEYKGYHLGVWRGDPAYCLELGDVLKVWNVSGYPHHPVVGGVYACL